MVARAFPPPDDQDPTYRGLVSRVVRGRTEAWSEFVDRFSNLIFSLVWRYTNGDSDLCSDLYLYVIEGLHQTNESGETFYRLRRYLESAEQYGGKGRLTTWLGRVTQNLVSDYFREQEGRRTIPRPVLRMDSIYQQAFKLLYWDCLSERECFETLRSRTPQLSRDKFDRLVLRINESLKNCNRWSLYSDYIRQTPPLPLHPNPEPMEGTASVQVADPDPRADPALSASARQDQDQVRSLGKALLKVIRALPDRSRLLLVCRFKHGMTAGEIAKLMKQVDEKRIYTEIEDLKIQLRDSLQGEGFQWENISGGLEAIDGLLDGFDAKRQNKKGRKGL